MPLGGGSVHWMLRSAFTYTVSRLRRRCPACFMYVCMYVLIRQQDTARHTTPHHHHPLTYRFGSRRAHKVVQLRLSHRLRRGNQGAQGMSDPSSRRSQGSGWLLRCSCSLAPSSASVCLVAGKVAPLASAYAPCARFAPCFAGPDMSGSFQGAPLTLSPHWRA